jgi:glycosyltransferase involved in cell wall biosynthesis
MNALNKISVIVCAHNEEKFLPRCVDSLLGQDFKKTEIILVDDASSDGTFGIMKEYAAAHPDRIRVIRSEKNLGLGGARNLALGAVGGEFLAFCDADDWVEPEMYGSMYREAIRDGSDICYCHRREVSETGEIIFEGDVCRFPTGNFKNRDLRRLIAFHTTFLPAFIFRRELFIDNRIEFPSDLRYEDVAVSAIILPYVKRISKVARPFYNYFIHSGTITTRPDESKYLDKVAVCRIFVDQYRKRGFYEKYRDEVNYLYFRKGFIHAALNYIINSSDPNRETVFRLRSALLSIAPFYRRNPYYLTRIRFVVLDILLSHSLTIKFLKLFLNPAKHKV